MSDELRRAAEVRVIRQHFESWELREDMFGFSEWLDQRLKELKP
jgi:hypothetical protein